MKNGKYVADLLDVIQKWKQLAIIRIPGHPKPATMDAAARQATLNCQIIPTQECSSIPIKSIEDFFIVPWTAAEKKRT